MKTEEMLVNTISYEGEKNKQHNLKSQIKGNLMTFTGINIALD